MLTRWAIASSSSHTTILFSKATAGSYSCAGGVAIAAPVALTRCGPKSSFQNPFMLPRFTRHKDTIASGLRLVTVELPHLHTASVVMYSKVGSRYETPRDNGLSHFLEHMLFRGTARYPDAYQMNYAIE